MTVRRSSLSSLSRLLIYRVGNHTVPSDEFDLIRAALTEAV